MRRVLLASACAALPMLALAPAPSFAISAQQQCEAAGGTFDQSSGGIKECTFTETDYVGNSGKPTGQTSTTTNTTTAQGNYNPQSTGNGPPEEESACSGPGNSTGSANCPDAGSL